MEGLFLRHQQVYLSIIANYQHHCRQQSSLPAPAPPAPPSPAAQRTPTPSPPSSHCTFCTLLFFPSHFLHRPALLHNNIQQQRDAERCLRFFWYQPVWFWLVWQQTLELKNTTSLHSLLFPKISLHFCASFVSRRQIPPFFIQNSKLYTWYYCSLRWHLFKTVRILVTTIVRIMLMEKFKAYFYSMKGRPKKARKK